MMSLLPEPYAILARIMAVVAVLCAAMFFGYTKGLHAGQARLDEYRLSVETQGNAQINHTLQVTKTQQVITQKSEANYENQLTTITAYYEHRLHAPDANSHPGSVSVISGPASGTYAPAPDNGIAEKCADTTAQLIALQQWVSMQETASP